MDKPYFRRILNSVPESPISVQGFPGLGNVGRVTVNLLTKFYNARLFAELYSPSFPDYVSVNSKGICRLPKYEFYVASTGRGNFIIMTGDVHPSLEDVTAHYVLCGEILDFIKERGCSFIVTVNGVPMLKDKADVYVAATSPRLATEFAEKGAAIYSGRIVGAAGLMLGLAKERGLEGVCLLGATTGLGTDREAGFSVFRFLIKALSDYVKEGL